MKWFFLSILTVYVVIDSSDINVWLKLAAGFKRVSILVLLMLLVSWLLNKTPRNQIIAAIIFLLKPLKYLGVSVETLALRIELIFQNIETVKVFVLERKSSIKLGKISSVEIGKNISGIYFELIKKIDENPLDAITVDLKSQAPLNQWLFPMMLFIMLYLIQAIS